MKKKIKHFSQIGSFNDDLKDWERKICGLTCIKMAIEYFNGISPSFEELLNYKDEELRYLALNSGQEKTFKYCLPNHDWLHTGLVKVANKYFIYGCREIVDKKNFKEIFVDYINKNILVIASVNLNFEPTDKDWWHLVLVVYITDEWLFINDPVRNEGNYFVSFEQFEKCFNGNIIVLGNENNEQFKSNNVIYIDEFWENRDILYFHIHENEYTAKEETQKFIQKNGWILYSLHNCQERFVRFQIISPEWDKIFVRIDPNRIFSQEWLIKTIVDRNSHLPQNCLSEALRIGNIIKNYILSKIDFINNEKLIIIHNNKYTDIWEYSKNICMVHKNPQIPKNAFIIVSNLNDFENLKNKNINTVFESNPQNNWTIRAYFQLLQKRCFSIETWFWDSENYQLFLEAINSI